MALLQPLLFDAVIALGVEVEKTKIWVATGFLFGMFLKKDGDQSLYIIYLVTNKHVLKDQKIVFARFDGGSGGVLEFDIPLFDSNNCPLWVGHPNDEIDVAVIRINHEFLKSKGAKFNFFQSDSHTLKRTDCKSEGITEGDGLFLLGFPLGIVGESQNCVIVRGGEIARIRDCIEDKVILS